VADKRKELTEPEDRDDLEETSGDSDDAPEDDDADDDASEDEETSDDDDAPEDEDQPEAGAEEPERSRVKIWIGVGVIVAIAGFLLLRRGPTPESDAPIAKVGTVVPADITLLTADRNDLDCLAEKGVGAYQCGFVDETTPRQVEERDRLRPFVTLDRHLYLIPGLFLEPAIAERFKTEPPTKPRDQLKRFTAKCKAKVAGELDSVQLRWSPTGTWEPAKKFTVATVSECKIDG
jgi:hypothetical protein